MLSPYPDRPDFAFWRRAVSRNTLGETDSIVILSFRISRQDQVAIASSCFLQHISSALVREVFRYLINEAAPASSAADDENYSVFSARYGNIYTICKLLQLFDRAYNLFEPVEKFWLAGRSMYIDPFRPRIQVGGYLNADALEEDRTISS